MEDNGFEVTYPQRGRALENDSDWIEENENINFMIFI